MKKILLILTSCLALCTSLKSQQKVYQMPDSIVSMQYTGTNASYTTIATFYNITLEYAPNYMGSGLNYIIVDPYGFPSPVPPGKYFVYNYTNNLTDYPMDSLDYVKKYKPNYSQVVMTPQERPDYMTYSVANPIIAAMTGSINTKAADNASMTGTVLTVGTHTVGINSGSSYTAGSGISITSGTITNTSPNVTQVLSGSGTRTISLSAGGGSVTIPFPSWSEVTSKPSFATVATSGSYNDLTSKPTIPTGITYSNATTTLSVTKSFMAVITPTAASGYSIDISNSGFTNVLGYSIIPIKNTANAYQSPQVSVKSVSSTAIVVNITEGVAAVVIAGPTTAFANLTGLTLMVTVYGN